jgi:hypothetical protein
LGDAILQLAVHLDPSARRHRRGRVSAVTLSRIRLTGLARRPRTRHLQ